MNGFNPWGGTPQFIYVPVPQHNPGPMPGIQTITSSSDAKELLKLMKKREKELKKEIEESKKKKEEKKPDEKKPKIDNYFATKWEVALFMTLIALPVGFCEVLLVRFLLQRLV